MRIFSNENTVLDVDVVKIYIGERNSPFFLASTKVKQGILLTNYEFQQCLLRGQFVPFIATLSNKKIFK